jgi:2-C-methyl-D-erythritol 4-phosphate cytidylyltransferase
MGGVLMNYALIFAGGTGQRMTTRAKPKQLLELHGKPIILYTLEHFEAHSEIDAIIVVCLNAWIRELKMLLKRYDIKKVTRIVPGGETGHDSIYCGLEYMSTVCKADDIVLIHDGVRPLINENLISDNIAKAKEFGSAITVESATESVVISKNGNLIDNVPNRGDIYTAKAPQSFMFGEIWELYKQARKDSQKSIDSAHLCSLYGKKTYLVKSPPNNMKITAPQDYYIFRALYEIIENEQLLRI